MQHEPQDTVRNTVQLGGGVYTTDVADLLGLFGRQHLTDTARAELTSALLDVGVGVEPHLFRAERDDVVNLFLLDSEPVERASGGAVSPPGHGQHRPQDIARNTVELYGGRYTTDVANLLGLFGRENFTDKARAQLTSALLDVGIAVEPDLFHAERDDLVNLFPIVSKRVSAPGAGRPVQSPARVRSPWRRLIPRTWKGGLAYGVLALLIVAVLAGDPDDGDRGGPPGPNVNDAAPKGDEQTEAKARKLRRERAERRRERARAEQVRRRRAAARRERERREALAAQRERERQQALDEQRQREQEEQRQQELAEQRQQEQCHPSYDPCLDPNASDYDCEGGSGDGPNYTGPVTVTGDDPYDLDRDGDGAACES